MAFLRTLTRQNLRFRADEPAVVELKWDPAKAAVVICDMWDRIQCVSAARRAAELAPRINEVATSLRERGTLIVHAPGGCADFYNGTRARDRAIQAPNVDAPAPIDWNSWNCDHHTELPRTLTSPGSCSCDSVQPCCGGGPPYPWSRQTPDIEVSSHDAVTDDGQELFNLLEERQVRHVIVMGVHTNVCILGRPYGIRQLVFWGKAPVLCRDLTDSFHRDPRGHFWGTEATIAHIERFWCPTVGSDDLVGGKSFRFSDAGAPQ
jgi:nicotinamidase-related amidase